MRMMKTNKNETIMVIGIDHGYGNMKTATRCFPSGVVRYEKELIRYEKVSSCMVKGLINLTIIIYRINVDKV